MAITAALIGCGGTTTPVDSGAGCTGSASTLACVPGAPTRACGDVAQGAVCVNGAWQCPQGTVEYSMCGCAAGPLGGTPPLVVGAECRDRDAGADSAVDSSVDVSTDVPRDDASIDAASDVVSSDVASSDVVSVDDVPSDGIPADSAMCGPMPMDGCVPGGGSVPCGDVVTMLVCAGGVWTCPDGMVRLSQCTCAGRPPGRSCVCTAMGWSCPDGG